MVAGIALEIGTIHEAETGAADEHVEIGRMALAQDPLEFFGLLLGIGAGVRLAPVIEPAGPVFANHARLVGAELDQFVECALCFARRKIHHRQGVRQGAVGEHVGAV